MNALSCVLIRQIPEHLEPAISICSQDKLRKKSLFYMQTHAYFRDLYSYKMSNQNLLAAETLCEKVVPFILQVLQQLHFYTSDLERQDQLPYGAKMS